MTLHQGIEDIQIEGVFNVMIDMKNEDIYPATIAMRRIANRQVMAIQIRSVEVTVILTIRMNIIANRQVIAMMGMTM